MGERDTYGKEFDAVESLARNDRHEFHFTQERDFGWDQARRQGQSHLQPGAYPFFSDPSTEQSEERGREKLEATLGGKRKPFQFEK